jgi:hypothetical protein
VFALLWSVSYGGEFSIGGEFSMFCPARDLRAVMAQVSDPRGRKGRRHPLSAILTAVVCAVMSGANGYKPIAQWLHEQPVDFWHFLGFTRRPLRYGALRNVLMAIPPEAFEDVLAGWLREVHGGDPPPDVLRGMSIDGKVMRGTGTIDQRALTLISAFDHEIACVLLQQAVPADTNEQKAGLELLKRMVLTGRVVTADAAHCYPETCDQVTDSGGHYVFTAKDNQPRLVTAISAEFSAADAVFSPLSST